MRIYSRNPLIMRNVSDKFVGKIKTHFLCSITFFFSDNCVVHEIMWKNMVQPNRPERVM